MINTVCESTVCLLDMQLVGKLAVSATALFLLALAYKFYKSRIREKGDIVKHWEDARSATREESSVLVASLRDHLDDETVELRLRRVNSNLQCSLISSSSPGTKNLADHPLYTQELHFKSQELFENLKSEATGYKSSDVITENKRNLNSVETKESYSVPDQVQREDSKNINTVHAQHMKDTDNNENLFDGNIEDNDASWETSRQDPEGKEMHDKEERVYSIKATRNIQASCGIDLSIQQDHENMHTVHRFSSVAEVQVEENIIADKQREAGGTCHKQTQEGGLKGKIYDYHVQSTSESITAGRDYKFGTISPLSQFNTDVKQIVKTRECKLEHIEQDEDIDDNTLHESLEHLCLHDLVEHRHSTKESTENSIGSLEIRSDGVGSSPHSTLSLPYDINKSPTTNIQLVPGPLTFHVSLNPESVFDVHLELGNCYEVLCLAKKHDFYILKKAAYKIMSNDYLQVLQNPSVYGLLNAAERDLILEERMKGRRFVVVADIDSQGSSISQNSSLSYYDNDKNSWHPLSNVPEEAVGRGCSMTTMFNYLFIALGCEGPGRQMKPSKRVFCYNPVTNNWQEISPLNEARPHCKLVALDGYLYAIGGECLHTVERYDPRENRWSYIEPLPNDTFAVAHMASAYDDEIFVTGGTIRYMLLRYHQKEKVWKSSLITGSKNRTTELVVANNFLYRFDLNRSMGISVHRCSIRARIWYECANYAMPYPAPFQCAVIDNNIYCISRNFHLRFLADDISPRFMDDKVEMLPEPKGILYPFVLSFKNTQ
ncbi:kelch domain-containing protein 7A [Rhinophrynus dorsalis]